ncbi:MAG: hypothetical protein WCE90_10790 [Candidatus Zixiibacteriota bacterium]
MRKSVMLCAALFLVSATAMTVFAFDGWVPFQPFRTESPPEVAILSSTPAELTLQISFPGMNAREVVRPDGRVYQALSVLGGGRTYNVGWAELPSWERGIWKKTSP